VSQSCSPFTPFSLYRLGFLRHMPRSRYPNRSQAHFRFFLS
jgi:hypothetical protein